jgi:hypothetical protein
MPGRLEWVTKTGQQRREFLVRHRWIQTISLTLKRKPIISTPKHPDSPSKRGSTPRLASVQTLPHLKKNF